MASTDSNQNNLSYTLCYGVPEGKALSRKFQKLLKDAGFALANDIPKSDIFIAHSAGCWQIPSNAKPKLVVYIGMPFPPKKFINTWLRAIGNDFYVLIRLGSITKGINIMLKHFYYLIRQPRHNYKLIRIMKNNESIIFPDAPTLFITNHRDPWPRTSHLTKIIDGKDWTFISLPGSHDNLWQHPDRYVDIIKQYARLLEKTDK